MEKIKDYKELRIWQKGMEIVRQSYALIKSFPKEERFGLTSQLSRAAVSLPTNVAEGFVRYHKKEYVQFLRIALGSAAELETHLLIAKDVGYLKTEDLKCTLDHLNHFSRMVSKLISKLNALSTIF